MRFSTKTKFSLLLLGSLGLLAVGGALFTTVGVERALSEKMRESGSNAVFLSANIVQDKFRGVFFLKLEQAVQMQKTLTLWENLIRGLARDPGRFPGELDHLVLPEGVTLWVMAGDGEGGHEIKGDMPDSFNPYQQDDIKGRRVGDNALRLAKAGQAANALVYAAPPEGNGRVYFGRNFYIRDSDLLVGLWADLEPASAMRDKHRQEAIASLQATLQEITIGPSGFLLVVDETGKVIVRPAHHDFGETLTQADPGTGRRLLDAVRAAAADPDAPVNVALPVAGGSRDALVYAEYNRAFKWYVAGFCFTDEIAAPGRRLSLVLAAAMIAAAACLALAAMALLGRLTAPLVKLADIARRLPETDFLEGQGGDDHDAVAEMAMNHSGDEVGELAGAFLFMDSSLRDRVRELLETSGVRERMTGELQAATGIQMGFLPRPLSEEKVRGRFAVAGCLIPAREVGGDLYDYFMLDDDRLCLVVGDVSDKGVPAALFMSMTMVQIRSGAADAAGPEEIMTRVNDSLSRDNPNCMFVTLFIAFLDLRTGELAYANAGHNPPLILSGSAVVPLGGLSGPVVGAFAGAPYTRLSAALKPGDILLMYTDGVSEAMNAEGELFGDDALRWALAECRGGEPETIIARLRETVDAHVGGAPASDDLTILCLKIN